MSSWSWVRDHEPLGRCTRRQCQWRSSLPGRQLQSKQDWDNQIAATLRAMALALACPCHVYGKSEGDQQCLVYGQGCGCKLNKRSMSNSCAGLSSFVSNSIPFCSSCCVSASNAHFLSLDEFPLSRNGCGPQKRKQKLSKTFFFGKDPLKLSTMHRRHLILNEKLRARWLWRRFAKQYFYKESLLGRFCNAVIWNV